MYYNGVYHLFYQYNPYAAVWGNISWAHSVSYNLVDWIHLEPALNPTENYDVNGCWSGSATLLAGEGKPLILYTGSDFLGHQVQNLAMPKDLSDPFLTEWVKSPHNPLMLPVEGINPGFFRDPTTAWQGPDGSWRVLVGSQVEGHGAALLYKSRDFVSWERAARPLHESSRTGMWECPDFYGVDDFIHVLKASFNDHDYYVVGRYDAGTDEFGVVGSDFMDDVVRLRYDYGVFYASKTFHDDAKKRRVVWGWVTEGDGDDGGVKRGWNGMMSFPRSVLLDEGKKQLIQWPIEEVEDLRGEKVALENKEIESGSVLKIGGITASQADVEVSFRVPNLEGAELIDEGLLDPQQLCRQKNASVEGVFGPFGLLVLASEDLTEQTAVFFRIFRRNEKRVVLMCSDQSRSSLQTPVKEAIFGSFLDVDPDQEISLRTLVDHSIVESFGGRGKSSITARVYPKLAIFNNSHIYAFNNGAKSIAISSLVAWSMTRAQITQFHTRRKSSIS
ncbi:beta-fructofuranosidase, insoluble isoenzyme CWINV1-like [Salvia miltiorrhiza]|uniref:beta-fructofuranosidase, insoluble isoenzyme CWINV1-like n=1 Tax=Salvia miltiorrhiza TaxID=226208 RepID=UPI0025AC26E8|nr:beta-fructofuranosidase, insoluble isoenzyme CWINV1-like [Salvia miltiorrhiza]XP_057775951.1 beta-fructofuranosidase, insoluble isoenzyme CWINV1-like [Salvia miltiorrhiza]XP_057775952.1 beta-fructofuranosidase, insoluble isoenzyme CWINV1-like [Salvia miltiorrhiza]